MSAITTTPAQLAEQDGAQLGLDTLDAMLAGSSQGERFTVLRKAIIKLGKSKHRKQAAGGFAGQLVNVLERGLEAIKNDRR